jgi:hypothetical protein
MNKTNKLVVKVTATEGALRSAVMTGMAGKYNVLDRPGRQEPRHKHSKIVDFRLEDLRRGSSSIGG